MDEYEQLHRLRELWSGAIHMWGRIFIPLGAGIVTLFVSLLPYFAERGLATICLLIGLIIFSLCMVYWRWLVHIIDRQIVELYPRMLELEKEMGWETQTAYYYRNLNDKSKEHLATTTGIPLNELKRKDFDFREFKYRVAGRCAPHDLLLEVWDEFHHKSVTDRGHKIQDCGTGIAAILFAVLVVLVYFFW